MIQRTRRHILAQFAAFGAGAGVLAVRDASAVETPVPQGAVALTIAGKIGAANRGAAAPDTAGLFKHHSIAFDKAMAFDREALLRLPQQSLTLTASESGQGTFAGPLLKDMLAAAGAANAGVRLMALDGFAVELSTEDLNSLNWTLALSQNGKPFGIGDFGPAWLVHTPANGASPSEAEGQKWVWSVFYIEVI